MFLFQISLKKSYFCGKIGKNEENIFACCFDVVAFGLHSKVELA